MTEMGFEVISATVQAIVDNAERLGLTWTMRPATVVSSPSNSEYVVARYDGDNAAINMVNISGRTLQPDTRVYAIRVPPSGNFIAGFIGQSMPYTDTIRLIATSASVEFTVPQNLRVIELDYMADGDAANVNRELFVRINNDTNAQYIYRYWALSGAAGSAGGHGYTFADTKWVSGVINAGGASANRPGSGSIRFQGWNNEIGWALNMEFICTAENISNSGTFVTGGGMYVGSQPWNTITLTPATGNFIAGSTFWLKGWV